VTKERLAVLRGIEQRLSCSFRNILLLDNALTHRSFVNENVDNDCCDNERLEFLGDAVLELCISDILMQEFPDYMEGQLSKIRASVVKEQPLAEIARKFNVGDCLLLGKGEEMSGGRDKSSLLANTFEAIIAAIYLDCGFNETLLIVKRLFSSLIEEGMQKLVYRDYKTMIQELARNRFHDMPHYTLISEYGPDHDKIFEMELTIKSIVITVGRGKSKKEAEQEAAKKALETLEAKLLIKD